MRKCPSVINAMKDDNMEGKWGTLWEGKVK